MFNSSTLSLATLPVDIIYRILDHIDVQDIYMSARNICQRLDNIIDTYKRYQVDSTRQTFMFSEFLSNNWNIFLMKRKFYLVVTCDSSFPLYFSHPE